LNAEPAENDKAKRGPGRPRTFDDEKFRRLFIVGLQSGLSRTAACKCFGIDKHTFLNQCKRDPTFKAEVKYAVERGKLEALAKIARSKDWRAAAWYLERVHYEEFAKKQPDVVTKDQLNSTIAAVVALLFSGNVPRNELEALAKIQGQLTVDEVPPPSPIE
jgi:hypothetical protein